MLEWLEKGFDIAGGFGSVFAFFMLLYIWRAVRVAEYKTHKIHWFAAALFFHAVQPLLAFVLDGNGLCSLILNGTLFVESVCWLLGMSGLYEWWYIREKSLERVKREITGCRLGEKEGADKCKSLQ